MKFFGEKWFSDFLGFYKFSLQTYFHIANKKEKKQQFSLEIQAMRKSF